MFLILLLIMDLDYFFLDFIVLKILFLSIIGLHYSWHLEVKLLLAVRWKIIASAVLDSCLRGLFNNFCSASCQQKVSLQFKVRSPDIALRGRMAQSNGRHFQGLGLSSWNRYLGQIDGRHAPSVGYDDWLYDGEWRLHIYEYKWLAHNREECNQLTGPNTYLVV